jgi:hypothetical protein
MAVRVKARVKTVGAGWGTELTAKVHLTERDERERDQLGRCEPKRKTYFLRRCHRHTGQMGQRGRLRPAGEGRPAGLARPKAK